MSSQSRASPKCFSARSHSESPGCTTTHPDGSISSAALPDSGSAAGAGSAAVTSAGGGCCSGDNAGGVLSVGAPTSNIEDGATGGDPTSSGTANVAAVSGGARIGAVDSEVATGADAMEGIADRPVGGARIGADAAGGAGVSGEVDSAAAEGRAASGDDPIAPPVEDTGEDSPAPPPTDSPEVSVTEIPAKDGVAARTGWVSSPRVPAAATTIATSRTMSGCMPQALRGSGWAVRPRQAATASAANERATCDHQIQTTTATTRIATPGGRTPLSTAATTDDHAGSADGSGLPRSLTRHSGTPIRNVPSAAQTATPDSTARNLLPFMFTSLFAVSTRWPARPATPAAAEAVQSSPGGTDTPRGARLPGGAHGHVPIAQPQHAHSDVSADAHRGPVAPNGDVRVQA